MLCRPICGSKPDMRLTVGKRRLMDPKRTYLIRQIKTYADFPDVGTK
jgi:hypothetical protein